VAIALLMAQAVDRGIVETWARPSRWAWGIGLILLLLFGVATLVQGLRSVFGQSDMRWFPARAQLAGPRGLLAVLGAAGLILLAVVMIGLWLPELVGRAAMAGMGVFILFVVLSRSRGFWEVPSVRAMRDVAGDRLILVLYAMVGLGCIGLALFGEG